MFFVPDNSCCFFLSHQRGFNDTTASAPVYFVYFSNFFEMAGIAFPNFETTARIAGDDV